MKRLISLVLVTAFALWLTGCAALRPTPPASASTSFRATVEKQSGTKTLTLDHVKETFGTLFIETREKSSTKDSQQWFNAETTSVGGLAAVLGQIASKTGLLNTGLGLTMGSLALKGLYDPEKTEETHLAAEEMFVCMQRELGPISEQLRIKAMSTENGGAQAATAIDDVIARIDEAIFSYRKAVLTQTSAAPSKDDFSRFAREYAKKEEAATQQTKDATDQLREAQKQRVVALATQDRAALALQGAATDNTKKAAAAAAAQEVLRLQVLIDDAAAKAAGAKFISLSTNLEACAKQFKK